MSLVFFVQLVCLKKGPLKRVWSVDKSRRHSLPRQRQRKCPPFPQLWPPASSSSSSFQDWLSPATVFQYSHIRLPMLTLHILLWGFYSTATTCLKTSCTPSAWVPHVSLSKQTQLGSARAGPPDNLSTFAVKMFTKMGLLAPGLCSNFYGSQSVVTLNTLVPRGTKGSLCWDIFHSKPQSHQHCCCHQTAPTE